MLDVVRIVPIFANNVRKYINDNDIHVKVKYRITQVYVIVFQLIRPYSYMGR